MPKEQFHFTLPHSVQGFQLRGNSAEKAQLSWAQTNGRAALVISIQETGSSDEAIDLASDTFTPKDVLSVSRHYELSACPLVYPGQTIIAKVQSTGSIDSLKACIRVKAYDQSGRLIILDGDHSTLKDLEQTDLSWTIPASLQNMPIQQVGIAVSSSGVDTHGEVRLFSLSWSGTPQLRIQRPPASNEDLGATEYTGDTSFWERSFVSSVDKFHSAMGPSFFLAQSEGEGIISHGTREWTDYQVTAHNFTVNLGASSGVAVRVRGLNRWYGLMFLRVGKVALVKARDEARKELATKALDWSLDAKYEIAIKAEGGNLACRIGDLELRAYDDEYTSGGVGLVVTEGSISTDSIDIGPVDAGRTLTIFSPDNKVRTFS
ncbi:uncharacterized protein AB675_12096 [Cyphellophora attinorum]|uniref:Uncharacterized protein n=1 Tax=Cyphellophora attinorum TaxID=1664694 RepID=A0A0N1H248_9EURO|nr:uncharacterized protein AB675_12096 [Phialophora attinorum]KPI38426.1 hypothetical protein AB675_12096 [Phialophora attinorum]